jgi:zinc protease
MKSVTRVTLDNGLSILLKEIHTAPLISTWLWYRVGSKDEPTGRTGVSHWVEHMLFKGTPAFPSGMLDKAIARDGGAWNAMTYFDWTTFFETLPADKAGLSLELEADRMLNGLFKPEDVASERTVIIAEREGDENEPMFKLGEAIQCAAFRVHPYHHEVIGDKDDLRSMTRDDLFQHYRTYYSPNNAVLTAAGDFKTAEMIERIRARFERIPAGSQPPRLARSEPPQTGEMRLTVEGPGETTYLQAAYHVPGGAHKDFMPLAVLDSLLCGPSNLNMFGGGGISHRTSRLYRAIVETEKAVGVSGGSALTIDPFLYAFTMTCRQDKGPETALAALDDEIKRVQDTPVSDEEIARAVKQAHAIFAYGSENITNQAFWLGFAEMFDTYSWFIKYLDRLGRVTAAEVQRVAQEYFRPQNRVVGTYLPVNGSH